MKNIAVELSQRIDDACRTHSIRSILGLDSNKRVIVCPLPMHIHSNNTGSFSIMVKSDGKEYFKCHGNCGHEGDAVDLVGYLRVPGYNDKDPKHIEAALELLEQRYTYEMPDLQWHANRVTLSGHEWKEYVPPGERVIAYAKSRGIEPKTLEHFNIGQDRYLMAIPTFEDHKLMGIKFRNTTENGLRYFAKKGSMSGLFNYDEVAYTTEPVLIVKGEIAAMVLYQYGFKVCAPTTGERNDRDRWFTALALSYKRVVIGDNDKTGKKYGVKRAEHFKADLQFPISEYKDVDEWILNDPGAVKTIESWLK
ncbi:MAG: hypothetical protein KQI81_08690 [Deltaproteobacteria bacterium]|nr:hypothetical protein [Deltaproteobacteria bacterium]